MGRPVFYRQRNRNQVAPTATPPFQPQLSGQCRWPQHGAQLGTERVLPGEMVIEHEGKTLRIPLLATHWSERLAEGMSPIMVRRHLEHEQLAALQALDPAVTLDMLWRWTDQKELVGRRGSKQQSILPRQVVWLVYGTRRGKRGSPRLLVPVILTLLTPQQQAQDLLDRGQLKALKVRQIERITGQTLTHKAIVVEMALSGMSTQQIARRIYHTPEAVDNYLRLFDRVLFKTLPYQGGLMDYLTNRGVDLEEVS